MVEWLKKKCGLRCDMCEAPPGECLLSCAPQGQKLRVKQILSGRGLCGRMASMGIYPGAEIEVVCAGCGCHCLVRVHGGTYSLGSGVSQKIVVCPEC